MQRGNLGVGEDVGVDLAFLIAYVALVVMAYARVRSTAWLVVTLAGVSALIGAGIAFALDRGVRLDRTGWQWVLLATLAIVVVLAWLPALGFSTNAPGTMVGRGDDLGWRRQALALWLPIALIVLGLVVITTWWTQEPAFLRPVSFLIGNGEAEDNAKWLDFASQFAAGQPISIGVPLGGPLELLLTGVATVMGVVSQAVLGGYNEVAVAANTIVFGEFLMVAVVLLALAPLVESRFRGSRIPAPILWTSMLFLAAATLVLIRFGHLTLQFTILSIGLWSAVFLSAVRIRRARLMASLGAAVAMTVWLPMNAVAVAILAGWIVVLIGRAVRRRNRSVDIPGIVITGVVAIGIAQPIVSSLTYALAIGASEPIGMATRGVATAVRHGLSESPVFGATGGTEQVGPVLAILAVAAVIAAALFLNPLAGPLRTSLLRRFVPIGLMTATALAIALLDAWATGAGPHYGTMKFGFLTVVIALATTMPLALMLIDGTSAKGMTQARWIGIGGVLVLLMIDSILPRAVVYTRPSQWSPPIPFNNTSGSYWYPADVNGTGTQPISKNPVACVYLPKDAAYPTAIVPSGLSDPQRVYACTRQLAGLAGANVSGQPLVDWLRREWFTNTPAWTDVYDVLASMSPEVRSKQVILLDDGSNVIGLETVDSLLQRFPKPPPGGGS